MDPIAEIYQASGGSDAPFIKLVDAFYAGVETDPILRPMYPADLTESKSHLSLFLIQRCGGPTTYSDNRGHPRMRGRHMPFKIGTTEKDAWIKNMFNALDQTPELEAHKDMLRAYFDDFANFMINQPG